jgi:hypothetical protein
MGAGENETELGQDPRSFESGVFYLLGFFIAQNLLSGCFLYFSGGNGVRNPRPQALAVRAPLPLSYC